MPPPLPCVGRVLPRYSRSEVFAAPFILNEGQHTQHHQRFRACAWRPPKSLSPTWRRVASHFGGSADGGSRGSGKDGRRRSGACAALERAFCFPLPSADTASRGGKKTFLDGRRIRTAGRRGDDRASNCSRDARDDDDFPASLFMLWFPPKIQPRSHSPLRTLFVCLFVFFPSRKRRSLSKRGASIFSRVSGCPFCTRPAPAALASPTTLKGCCGLLALPDFFLPLRAHCVSSIKKK